MKRLIVDLDDTLTIADASLGYSDVEPRTEMIDRLREYKEMGFEIVIHTARNMRTYSGNVGRINANTLPVIMAWLAKHDVPFDEIFVGKPWCGSEGFYVDDKSVRPDEFAKMSYKEIKHLLKI